jgi:copper(I)-binding protein
LTGFFVAALCAGSLYAAPSSQLLRVEDPWVREGPPNARVLAGFMKLANPGPGNVRVISVTSPDFARIEIHRTEVVDGIARMAQQSSIDIPPGGSVELKPGGMHLMLFNPAKRLRQGASVTLSVDMGDGSIVTVETPVVKGDSTTDEHHHHRH